MQCIVTENWLNLAAWLNLARKYIFIQIFEIKLLLIFGQHFFYFCPVGVDASTQVLFAMSSFTQKSTEVWNGKVMI